MRSWSLRRQVRPLSYVASVAALCILAAAGCSEPVAPVEEQPHLLFLGNRDDARFEYGIPFLDIYRMNLDGTGVENLTRNPSRNRRAVNLHPDGRRIIFSGSDCQIWIMNTDGSGLAQLTGHSPDEKCSISPRVSRDGTRIAFLTNREGRVYGYTHGVYDVYVMNLDGSAPRNVGRALGDSLGSGPDVTGWTPDGRVMFETNFFTEAGHRLQVYAVKDDGTGLQPLLEPNDFAPEWSPDGSKLLFVDVEDGEGTWVIRNADGSGVFPLIAGGPLQRSPSVIQVVTSSWSPDGSRLVISRNIAGGGLFMIDVDGTDARRVADFGVEFNGWSPRGDRIALSDGSDIILVWASTLEEVKVAETPYLELAGLWLPR